MTPSDDEIKEWRILEGKVRDMLAQTTEPVKQVPNEFWETRGRIAVSIKILSKIRERDYEQRARERAQADRSRE